MWYVLALGVGPGLTCLGKEGLVAVTGTGMWQQLCWLSEERDSFSKVTKQPQPLS